MYLSFQLYRSNKIKKTFFDGINAFYEILAILATMDKLDKICKLRSNKKKKNDVSVTGARLP